ncbi:MAG: hypothetical protein AB8B73_13075 [Ekhidna sp.]
MNFPKLGRKWISSFLNKKREDETTLDRESHFLYEFDISSGVKSMELIRNRILLNPYSLIIRPTIKLSEGKPERSMSISFFVLNKEEGKKIQQAILSDIDQSEKKS